MNPTPTIDIEPRLNNRKFTEYFARATQGEKDSANPCEAPVFRSRILRSYAPLR